MRSRHIVVARSQQPIVYRELSPFPFCGHTYIHIERYGDTQSGAVRGVTKREMGTTDTEAATGEGRGVL